MNRRPADRRFDAFVKLAYAVFLIVSIVVGSRFLYQFGQAAHDQWRNRHRNPVTAREWTIQEFHFAPVELNPTVQARIDELQLSNGSDELSDPTTAASDRN